MDNVFRVEVELETPEKQMGVSRIDAVTTYDENDRVIRRENDPFSQRDFFTSDSYEDIRNEVAEKYHISSDAVSINPEDVYY